MDVRQRVTLCATYARSIHVGVVECSGNRQGIHETRARAFPRSLPSTFVVLAAFIDGKSVAASPYSKISVGKPEGCHFSRRNCRCYMPRGKILPGRKLDRQIPRGFRTSRTMLSDSRSSSRSKFAYTPMENVDAELHGNTHDGSKFANLLYQM